MSVSFARSQIGRASEHVSTAIAIAVVESSSLLMIVVLEGLVHVRTAGNRLRPRFRKTRS